MPDIRLTKSELRDQQIRLTQLNKYLPTLQLKKAMLQSEVNEARAEIGQLQTAFEQRLARAHEVSALMAEKTSIDPADASKIDKVNKRYENIAGVDVPYYEGVVFEELIYNLFDTPPWIDGVIQILRDTKEAKVKIDVAIEKKEALERELREVSIRVNLFEKILIPRAIANIKKIKVFLGDQELAAVGRAKVAKSKIEAHRSAALLAREAVHAH